MNYNKIMTAPNITAVTASIERSLQNCSLNSHSNQSSSSSSRSNSNSGGGEGGGGIIRQSGFGSADSPENLHLQNDNLLELNSGSPLPYYWEQCLDLKTGEVYFINWRTGMKSQEDPRTNPELINGEFYSGDDTSYDSEGSSSSESSPSNSREPYQFNPPENNNAQVLVVAGCKSCLMYFMVPKQVEDCPKCYGQLLHFDRSENGSP